MYEKVASVGAHAAIVAVALWATAARSAVPAHPIVIMPVLGVGPHHHTPGPVSGPEIPMPIIPSIPFGPDPLPAPGIPGNPVPLPAFENPVGGPAVGTDTTVPTLLMVDEAPELLSVAPPIYPALLRQAGVSGSVVIEAVVDTAGRVEPRSLRVVDATDPAFGASALASVRSALFRPARMYGKPVRVLVRLPVVFALRP
jgi:protein TonB